MSEKKLISITGGCFNEANNLPELYDRCKKVMELFPQYDFELLLIDNCSNDGTRDVIRQLAANDKRVKAIFNAANYGHIRSPFYGMLQAEGDAVVTMCTDLQDPPEKICDLIREWENGAKVVICTRKETECSLLMELIRKSYYLILEKFSNEEIIKGFTGFGLYDKQFMDALKKYHDSYPYFRGLVSEIGFKRIEIPFVQPCRKRGITKNNFFTLYDLAMTGVVNHTKLPLRMAIFTGFVIGVFSILISLVYFIFKLIWWDSFNLGLAPLVMGMFFLGGVQLFFIGIIGEYIGAIWTQVKKRPLVIEEERINFNSK